MLVMSDNGGCPYSGGYNYPLRGAKQYLWEGGIRVNAFVHSPLISRRARGTKYNHLFHVSDWLPTIVTGVLHAAPGLLGEMDGVDHWKHIIDPEEQSKSAPRHEILHNIDLWSLYQYGNMTLLSTPVQAIRVGDMKLFTGQDASKWYEPESSPCQDGTGYCTPTYESTDDCSFTYSDTIYLFNITADPSETTNLAQDFPDVVQQLEAKLEAYQEKMEAPAFRVEDYHKAYQAFIANNDFIGPFFDGGHE
jgi:arylsulfatase A-like enzyme